MIIMVMRLHDVQPKSTPLLLREAVVSTKNSKRRELKFHEINQDPVFYHLHAFGSRHERLGRKPGKRCSGRQRNRPGARAATNHGCRRSGFERCYGRTAATDRATYIATGTPADRTVAATITGQNRYRPISGRSATVGRS